MSNTNLVSHPQPFYQLIRALPGEVVENVSDVLITGIVLDSRQVQPGNLFMALSGGSTDGHRFIPEAIMRGASAIVGTQPLSDLPVPYFRVDDGRMALAYLAAAFYGFPARQLLMIGVTGTDGKTTTANLLFHILQIAGLKAGMISTVNAVIGEQTLDTGFHVTTPEAPDVQRYLAQMVAAGLTHVILEATSHGLAQQRVGACDFDVGIVTNITHEHLDYHGSYSAYRSAKASLFAELANTSPKVFNPPRGSILNRDDQSYEYLAGVTTVEQVSYGFHPLSDVRAEQVEYLERGSRFVAYSGGPKPFRISIESHLQGAFNVSNCLAAVAAGVSLLGLEPEAAQQGIATLAGVPGRMEHVELGQDFMAIVDFAHTPNALRNSLQAAQQLALAGQGRLIAVFGSAGLRDRAKRRMMAETSVELADITLLTAEDPRTDSLPTILAEMAAGADARGGVEGQTFWRIPDRREAIRFAVAIARPGDVVIACGKGHEQSMCFGEVEYPWDDRVALRAALAERLGIPGPEMPYLPTSGSVGMFP